MNTKKELHTRETARLTGKDLLTAMNYLEEEIVELQPQETKKTAKLFRMQRPAGRVIKWAAAAALALCFISGSVVFAASKLNFSFLNEKDSDGRSRYKLEFMVDQIPAEELTGEVQKVGEQFMADAANGIYPVGDVPRGFVADFSSEKEALDYIGYAGIKETMLDAGNLWVEPVVAVFGDREGHLSHVRCSFARKIELGGIEHIDLYQGAEVYTNGYPYDFIGTIDSIFSDKFQRYEYVTKNGCNALVLLLEDEDQCSQTLVRGYVLDGAVVYSITISHNFWTEKNTEAVEALMKQWLEQF